MQETKKPYLLWLIAIMIALSLYRLFVLLHSPFDLYFDEAYYFNWAKHLDFGYYSKPPMLSWLIASTTWLFGESEAAIKSGAMLLYPLTTLVIYQIGKLLYDEKVGFYSALIFFTLPSVWMSSLIISTDVVLLFFWSLALLFFLRALYHDKLLDWILAGVFSGFGLLSKYNFIFFLISVLLILAFIPKYRKHFTNRSLYLSMVIAFVIFLPNLIWNYQHDFISFVHTKQISHVSQQLIHPNKFIEFFGAQFLVFGPILFFYYWVIVSKRAFLKDERYLMLFLFSITTLGFIMILSFISRSFANWAAVTYVSASILVVAYLLQEKKERLLKLSIGIHTLLAVIFFHYHAIAGSVGIELTRKNDPYKRVSGWAEIAYKIKKEKEKYPETLLLTDGRAEVAEFDYYMQTKSYIFNPTKAMDNQYHMTRDLNTQKGKNFLFVSEKKDVETLTPYFVSVKKVGRVNEVLYPDFNRTYNLWYLQEFKGY